MPTHSFSLVLADTVDDLTRERFLELSDRLDSAGCDDATTPVCGGVVRIAFDREPPTLADAIASAIADVTRAGCTAARVEPEEQDVFDRINAELVRQDGLQIGPATP